MRSIAHHTLIWWVMRWWMGHGCCLPATVEFPPTKIVVEYPVSNIKSLKVLSFTYVSQHDNLLFISGLKIRSLNLSVLRYWSTRSYLNWFSAYLEMARSSSSIAIVPVLTATLVLFAKHVVAFNAPRITQNVQFSTKGLRTHHNVEMAVQLRLPPMSSLPSPSSWMGGYLRAIDMHNGDLQMPTRRGTSVWWRISMCAS